MDEKDRIQTEAEEKSSRENVNNSESEKKAEASEQAPKKFKDKSIPAFIFLLCILAYIGIYSIVNISSLTAFVSRVFEVFLPVILGAAIAFILNPLFKLFEFKVFKKLENKKVVRILSILCTYVVVVLFIVGFLLLIIPSLVDSIMELAANYDTYIADATAYINEVIVKLTSRPELAELIDPEAIKNAIIQVFDTSGDIIDIVLNYLLNFGGAFITGLKNIVVALFISIYMLSAKDRLKAQFNKFTHAFFSNTTNGRISKYSFLANKTFGSYFVGMIIDSFIVGIMTFLFMIILRIPYAPLIAVTVGVTNIIPFFGPFIGAIPSFFIILIAEPPKAIIFALMILVIQQIDGNIIVPRIHGNSTGLSSLGVIIAIVVMGEYLGVIGMIIGVPIAAVVVTIIKEFVEHRLKLRDRPTDTAYYYAKNSMTDPYEKHENPWVKVFHGIARIFVRKKADDAPSEEGAEKETEESDNTSEK